MDEANSNTQIYFELQMKKRMKSIKYQFFLFCDFVGVVAVVLFVICNNVGCRVVRIYPARCFARNSIIFYSHFLFRFFLPFFFSAFFTFFHSFIFNRLRLVGAHDTRYPATKQNAFMSILCNNTMSSML